jgi:hypothetical protein
MGQRSASTPPPYKNKRLLAVLGAVVVCGGLLTVTQVAGASTWRKWGNNRPPQSACPPTNGGNATQGTASPSSSASKKNGTQVTTQGGRQVRQWGDDDNPNQRINRGNGRNPRPNCTPTRPSSASPSSSSTTPPLDIQGTSCDDSRKQRHTGFQEDAERCVATDHGEVGQLSKNPTALIVQSPQSVRVGEAFQVVISTRNIIRDRFLAAAQGGYYAEMDQLAGNGLARGHAHFACNVLANTNEAPAPSRSQFFVAIEDRAGSATPDRITVNVTGLPSAGTASCALWLGGQSHRLPMMAFANSVPGFDAVRIQVR